MKKKSIKHCIKLLVFLFIVTAIITCYNLFDLGRFINLTYLRSQLDYWRFQLIQSPLQFSLIFCGIYILVTAASIPGAFLLTMLAGALFGLGWGTVLVSFSSTVGASLAFLIGRLFLRDYVATKFNKGYEKIDAGFRKEGGIYLFGLRLVPIFPFFVVNLVMSLTSISLVKYALISQIGMLAGTILYVNAGLALSTIEEVGQIFSGQIIVTFMFIAIFPLLAKRLLTRVKTHAVYKPYRHNKPKKYDYNVVVIGAGAGGLVASYIATTLRAKVALIEKNNMGGDCLNTGCVPSKSLLSLAKLVDTKKIAQQSNIRFHDPLFSFSTIMKRVHDAIARVAPHDSVERYRSLGVECIEGEARIRDPWHIAVKDTVVSTRSIIVATGGSPKIPKVEGIHAIPCYTSDTIWNLTNLPRKLLVLGGGFIACELSYAFSLLGSRVTLVCNKEALLPTEDRDVSDIAKQTLGEAGVTMLYNTHLQSCSRLSKNEYLAHILDKDGKKQGIDFSIMLSAIGRSPCSDIPSDIPFETNDHGLLTSNEFLQTQYPNIYTVGDVSSSRQFTHLAGHMGWYASVNALLGGIKKFKVNFSAIPSVTYISPELARIGLNEREAKMLNIDYESTIFYLEESDRAIAENKTKGFVKFLTPPKKDTILGATIVCDRAGEMISEISLAMSNKLGLNSILKTIHPYPSYGEAIKSAAGLWKKKHAPKNVLNFLERIFETLRN